MSEASVLARPMNQIAREEVEDFLYAEAELLDRWQLRDWEALFTDEGRYEIAPLGIDAAEKLDPERILFLVADDRTRITQRTIRLLKKTAHAEYPRSRTRHLVSNIRISQEEDDILTSACFVVFRIRRGEVMTYMGQVFHRLRKTEGALGIVTKRVCLDLEALKPQGTVSIIL
jgi:p-cumate 2,3-dioxygenase beta subunit